ncbi:MAG TPA: NAD-dependent epimerase/dehydratase family protein [Pirellulales bacterium]|nr:NAD-dependent epimerase/dehydratase family protein [Pirellulales bacterium]
MLITGGCGFVGRWVARALASAEADLHILDLSPSKHLEVKHTFHHADLRNLTATTELVSQVKPAMIIHLAGQPGVASSHDNPVGAYEANVLATFNILEACRQKPDVEAIVAVSSNHVYGRQHKMPTAEDAQLNAVGMYAASKLAADVLSRAYGKTYDVPVGIARMTNSYGGDDHHVEHIITATILSALRNQRPVIKQSGQDRKGYLYIKDTAHGLLAIAEGVARNKQLRGEAFNLAPNEAVTVIDLVRTILSTAGKSLEPQVLNPQAGHEEEHLDNSKARELLGWTPQFNMPSGLREAIAWFSDSDKSPLHAAPPSAH